MTRAKITRLESWVNLGIPDCLVGLFNNFLMVELKVASPFGKVAISPHQVAFHTAHKDFPTWVLVQHGKGRSIKVLGYRGSQIIELSNKGTALPPTFEASYPIDWQTIEELLGKLPT